ncbi:S8 family peptidase [Paludifilum halophilum]|uniref:Peptidase S8 n=1 Tax=Paludifilum halophilum TaxID=1642702 RepID=A0A235B9J1_9BACL|nr:S8 family peptidase [Paludifilum halophilum]OYD08892.1 peptidase S8 [Paludifilum halophilum]
MSPTPYRWIREYGCRMDSDLRSCLIRRLHVLRWIPCVLHRAAIRTLHHFRRIRVLVQLEDGTLTASNHLESALYKLNTPSPQYFNSIRTYSLKLSMDQLQEVIELPGVKRVYLDRKVYALLDTATKTTKAPIAWSKGNEGEGANIAVIDTGIHPHSDLTRPQNRIIAFKDFVKGKKSPYDDNGHGTHCAGDAAGNGFSSQGKYRGPASKASLIGVKVLGKTGSGNLSDVISGIQWCIDHKDEYNIRVLSISLGSQSHTSYRDDPIAQIVGQAWKQGIVVVAAAGNDGPDAGTISSPGIHPRIITVGATDDRKTPDLSDDRIASFSSRGPTTDGVIKPDIVAPGSQVTSLRAPGSYIDKMSYESRVDQHYSVMSGTSMATPIVAGIAAILLTEHPEWTPDQVKRNLMKTAADMGLDSQAQGSGQVQIRRSQFTE